MKIRSFFVFYTLKKLGDEGLYCNFAPLGDKNYRTQYCDR